MDDRRRDGAPLTDANDRLRRDPDGSRASANRRPPGFDPRPHGLASLAHTRPRVWKCENPQTGFPHFHDASHKMELDIDSRFIEGSPRKRRYWRLRAAR